MLPIHNKANKANVYLLHYYHIFTNNRITKDIIKSVRATTPSLISFSFQAAKQETSYKASITLIAFSFVSILVPLVYGPLVSYVTP